MARKDNFGVDKIKKEQVEKIKKAIQTVVNSDKEYYKDKDYAKKL